MNNDRKFILQLTTYSTALLMVAGSVIQAFLLENGINEVQVTTYFSVVQIVQVAVMFFASFAIDRMRNVIKICAYTILGQIILFVYLITLCIDTGQQVIFKFAMVFAVGVVANVIQAVYNVVSYKLPYHVIEMDKFAVLSGKVGVATGIIGIAVSAVMSYATSVYDYNRTMLVFFVFGAIMLVLSFGIMLWFEPRNEGHGYSEIKKKKGNLFRYKPFTLLIVPNLLRGFCAGILIISMTIGYSLGITNQSSGAVLTLLLQIATVIGCVIYTVITKPRNDGKIILISSICMAIFMPAMLISNSLIIFYIMYFAANIFLNFVNNAVPVAVCKFVDYTYIGQYSSWRMLLHTLGIGIANAVATPLLRGVGGMGTMVIAVVCQLISGVAYYVFLRKCKYVDQ